MIDDTQLEHWKTKAEASEILKCSEKTISRLAAQKRIQKLMRRNPGTEGAAGVQSGRHRGAPRPGPD